jgi:hypothetical protein
MCGAGGAYARSSVNPVLWRKRHKIYSGRLRFPAGLKLFLNRPATVFTGANQKVAQCLTNSERIRVTRLWITWWGCTPI